MSTRYQDGHHSILPPEYPLYKKGYRFIAGVDEVGRGPLAGPVVAAAVVFPADCSLSGIADSKQLTPLKRERLYGKIFEHALSVGLGSVDQGEIDRTDILRASLKAMSLAVKNLSCQIDYVLVDGTFPISTDIPQMTIKKGDALSVLIGAASIVAKVTRDTIMKEYHQKYPCYNFVRNMGYGTKEHLNAIKQFGYSPIHRKTFRGVVKGTPNLFQAPCDE